MRYPIFQIHLILVAADDKWSDIVARNYDGSAIYEKWRSYS